MAIELGKAYVQILPSAKGISGSIQKAIAPEATAAGKSAGRNIATAITESLSKVGSAMTKYITTPALAATTAVTGLVGALGFKRLINMDQARAKLKGLGIEGKQLEIVMKNAKDAVTGTTHTMADGVNVAAGALAAGVKEGAELERYIKLVGDAATGANAPIAEMAQIFNRIQGTGKITRTELDMLEYRLPGFSRALMEHVGAGSREAFFEMVRAGKISSKDVLDTMENFAGGMSAAYAETWEGMKANIKSNIGIIGEALLQGLFEDGKKGMAKFLDFLRNSQGLKDWARNTGETIRNAVQKIVEVAKLAIQWWSNLSDGTKKIFAVLAGIAVAAGPIVTILSKLINSFKLVSGALAAMTSPVGLVTAAITGLIAIFVTLYRHNEDFRKSVQNVWESIKETITTVIQAISDFVKQVWGALTDWWNKNGDSILQKALEIWNFIYETISTIISEIVGFVIDIFGGLVEWWKENSEMILQAAQNVWNFISAVISTVMNVIWGIMQALWPVVQALVISTWEAIKGAIEGAINIITGIIQFFSALFTGNWSALWDSVKKILSGAWDTVRLVFMYAIDFVKGLVSKGFGAIKNVVNTIMNAIKNTIGNIFNSLWGIVSNAFSRVKNAVSNGMTSAFNEVKNFFGRFKEAGKNIVTSIADGIKGAISKVTDAISNVTQKIRNFLPFSPPKEGPLIDIMDVKWGETISAGILKGEGEIASAMERALDFDLTKKATFNANSNSMPHYTAQQQPQPIVLQVDGKTFAQIIGDYTSAEGGNRIRRIERGLAT